VRYRASLTFVAALLLAGSSAAQSALAQSFPDGFPSAVPPNIGLPPTITPVGYSDPNPNAVSRLPATNERVTELEQRLAMLEAAPFVGVHALCYIFGGFLACGSPCGGELNRAR
jgi:hypothetical protein